MEDRIEPFEREGKQFIYYISRGATRGLDGIERIMVNSILKMSGRSGIPCFRARDEAAKRPAAL
jgi:hypothetical protein